ncbi:hypothetical protein K443DRAFT_89796, partial [Laccaria amethystina LaAM-08-1]
WFNPFDELAAIPSSLIQHHLFASGHRQTSHIHRSSDRLRPVVWLFGHSPLPKLQTLYVSLHIWPQSLPVIRAIVVSGLNVHTAQILCHRVYHSSNALPSSCLLNTSPRHRKSL